MRKSNLIKVVNPKVADKLVALGFSYIKEQIGNQNVFVFENSRILLQALHKNFSKSDYFVEHKLRF